MNSPKQESGDAEQRRCAGMEAVIDTYQTPLLRYAAHLLNNASLAQDVVQNTFLKLFRQWQPGMRPDERLKGWLFRVAHNEAVDLIRAETCRRKHQEGHLALVMAETDGGCYEDPRPDERKTLVMRCLGVLTPAQRQVVLLRMEEGMSYEAISGVTGQTTGCVGSLLHTAVLRLSDEIRKREGGAP